MRKLISLTLLSLLLFIPQSYANSVKTSKTIVLVRHAEKAANQPDPGLTPEGQARAKALLNALAGTELSLAITTQFLRTQETLAPLIANRGLPHNIIMATQDLDKHIQDVVNKVNQQEGNVIIAGHSNTVPLIIHALGGPKLPIIGESEYDKLFILTMPNEGAIGLITTQYGARSSNTQ